jgi:cysteine-rich repeat protein
VAMAISDSVDGTCIGIGRDDRHPVVYAARSTDGCRSFDSVHALADLRANRGNCNDCVLPQAVVRSLGAGRWIAAWTASGQVTTGDSVDGVYVARSSDDGRTWTIAGGDKPKPVFSDYAPSGLDLEAGDSAGSAVMAFAGEDLFVARTGNGGSSWSSATRVAEGMGCLDCNSLRFFNRIDLARGTDRLLLAFASHRWRTEEFGNDGDVFVAASTNGGGSWSDPEPIAGWAATDGSRDAEPTIATDGDGRWVATWSSHHRVDGGDELAPDVVVAVSEDGQHWDAPTKVAGVIAADADEASPTFQDGPRLAWDARGVGMLTWTSTKLGVGGDSWARRVYAAVADASCGDGNVDVGEDCDDGGHSGDCYDDCTLPGCGNGHLDDGELCDDGDARDDNGCSTLCLAPYCGDGIVSPGEDCDDANDIDTDACTNTCREARCGDGVVWEGEEVCDPADPADDGWCVRDCTRGFCGDGIVSPAFELCDDGNDEDGDRCPSDCSEAWCGDGYTAPGVEECDPFDSRFGGVCTYDCKLATVCGDANGDEKISAGDALRVLQRGVDLPMDCPELACDIDANGTISATDAAMDLAMAVGRNVEGHCTLGTGWIVFSTEDPREIGSLQLTINYSATGGTFVNDRDGKAVCEGLAGGEYAYNNQPDLGTLDMAMITLDPLSGPVDIFRCLFELEGPAREAPLALAVTDASTPDANPLEPFPLLTFRLE